MKMKVKISKLEPMHKPQIKKATYKTHVESVSSRFPLELNLIGMRVEEGIAALDKYLDQAVVNTLNKYVSFMVWVRVLCVQPYGRI